MSQQEQGAPSSVRIIIAEACLSANESRVLQCLASNLHADYVVVPAAISAMHAHSRQAAPPSEDASQEEADRQTAPAQWESALLQSEEQQGGQRKGKQQRSRSSKPQKQAQMQMARQKAAAAP
jgi:hypothetical protein